MAKLTAAMSDVQSLESARMGEDQRFKGKSGSGQHISPSHCGHCHGDQLPPPDFGNLSALILQLGFFYGMNQIAFANRRPVQAIGSVQDNFPGLRRACGGFGGTHEHIHVRLAGNAVGMRNDHTWMRLRPARRLPAENVKWLHSSNGGTFLEE